MPVIGNRAAAADINLIDETFDDSQAESYHLYIQTEPDRLTFCVFNAVVDKCIVLRSYPFPDAGLCTAREEYGNVFEVDRLLGLNYKSSGHLWVSPRSTLVPEYLFDADTADEYLAFNHGATTGEKTLYNHIKACGAYNVFSCPETLTALLALYQPRIRLYHHATPFLESIVGGAVSQSKPYVAVCFYSGSLDIAVSEERKLLFYNTFQIGAPEDSVYYLAGISNLFDVDLLTTKLMYAGNARHIPTEVATLKDYVERIVEFEPLGGVTYSHYMSDMFRKKFINLFNLYRCES
jgi:hypothetical protein